MKNNKGQTLALFVIIIPFLLALACFVIDLGYIQSEKSKLNETTQMIIDELLTKDYSDEQIKKIYVKNDIEVEHLDVSRENDKIRIKADYEVDSILGNIIGIKKYKIKTNIQAIEERKNQAE